MRKKLLFLCFFLLLSIWGIAQDRTVSGKITDSKSGEALPGVSVFVKGSTIGTVTDAEGKFQLNNVSSSAVLVFQAVGLKTQEVSVGSRSTFELKMDEDIKELGEIVVTALGIEREKASLGYAIEKVEGNQLISARESNIVNAIAGRVSGVQISNSSGQVGASSRVVIRGNSSFLGNNQPLFVIDGVPIDNSQTFQGGQNGANGGGTGDSPLFYGGTSNRGLDLDPNSIESMSILKGTSATALYGVRAANGVILITTKKGTVGQKKPQISYGFNYGVSEGRLTELQDTYAQGLNGQYRSGLDNPNSVKGTTSWGPKLADLRLDATGEANPNGTPAPKYRNAEEFFRTGNTYNHTFSIAGGGANAGYFLSYSNLNDQGIVLNNKMLRNNLTAKFNIKLSEKLDVTTSLNYSNTDLTSITEGNGRSAYMWTVYAAPISYNLRGQNDKDYLLPNGTQRLYRTNFNNPYFTVDNNRRKSNVDRFIPNLSLTYQVLPWLSVSTRLGADIYTDNRDYREAIGTFGDFTGGRVNVDAIIYRQLNNDFLITANKRFNDFGISVTLGNQINDVYTKRNFTQGVGLAIPNFYNLSNATTITTSEILSRVRLVGIYGQATLDYKNYLFFTLTGRNDWASTLSINNNSFFYPSASLSFVFTEGVTALQNNDILSMGKVRVSWAQAGNIASPYNTQETVFTQSSVGDGQRGAITTPFQGQNGFTISNSVGNPNLKNELTDEIEVGLELGLLRSRVNIEATYYSRTTKNQILNAPVAASSGAISRVVNAGSMRNKGIEILANATALKYKGFQWDLGFTFTKNENVVADLTEGVDNIRLAGFTSPGIYIVRDQGYGVIWGSQYTRNSEGKVIINSDPTSGAYGMPLSVAPTLGVIGNTIPDWEMGIRTGFSYQNDKLGRFSLGGVLQIRQGGDILNLDNFYLNFYGVTKATEIRDGVRNPDGTVTGSKFIYPNAVKADGTPNDIEVPINETYWRVNWGLAQEDWVEDGSFVRLREVTFTYSLPRAWLNKTPLGSIDFSVTGRNLWLHAPNFTGSDPEGSIYGSANGQGFYNYVTPNTVGWNFGVNITF